MKLKVLADNNTFIDMYYLGEPALSFYIEDEDTKILFDTGYSDIFLLNAQKMGIDIGKIDKIVLSHGHNDHTNGLKYLLKKYIGLKIICHPCTFEPKEDDDGLNIGAPYTLKQLQGRCKLTLSDKPLKISKHLTYLGEIERTMPFEKDRSIGKRIIAGKKENDPLTDDSALVYEGDQGLFIITGCSHAGICNIIEYAKKVTGNDTVHGVIGGFHLFNDDKALAETIRYFKENRIRELYPCHCVSLKAKIAIARQLPIHEVGVGLQITI